MTVNYVEIHAELDADDETFASFEAWLDEAPATISLVLVDGDTFYSLRDKPPVSDPR